MVSPQPVDKSGHKRAQRLLRPAIAVLLLLIAVLTAAAEIWPATGKRIRTDGGFSVDYSHAADGYMIAKAPKSKKKLKLILKCGSQEMTYDIEGGKREVYSLTLGNGTYTATLYENKAGNKYTQQAQVTFKVNVANEFAPFLCPSKYVWYTPDSPAVQKSHELCDHLATDREKVEAVRDYMVRNFTYDYMRAVTQRTTYQGDVDGVFESGMGLCQDFACIAAAMLRVQGIPTQMVTGEAKGAVGVLRHAWNYVYVDGQYERLDITSEMQGYNKMTYTPEKMY